MIYFSRTKDKNAFIFSPALGSSGNTFFSNLYILYWSGWCTGCHWVAPAGRTMPMVAGERNLCKDHRYIPPDIYILLYQQ